MKQNSMNTTNTAAARPTLQEAFERFEAFKAEYENCKAKRDDPGAEAVREHLAAWHEEMSAFGEHYCRLYREYRDMKRRGNDCIDFADVVWDRDVEPLVREMRASGIKRFTFSSTYSSAVNTAWLFQEQGCVPEGLIRINSQYQNFGSDDFEKAPAWLFRVN